MAKLKNYEIDAIYNEVYDRIQELKEAKLNDLKAKVKLNHTQNHLLLLLQEVEEIEKRRTELLELGATLYKEAFDTDYAHYGWTKTTKEDIITHVANKLLPEKMQVTNINKIRGRIILANIDGNVQELIDNILAEYNE